VNADWTVFYIWFAHAVRGRGAVPVDPWDAVAGLEVVEAAQTGLPEMLGTRECQIALLNWGNGHGWPAGPCYYARL
jgi:hypothetical protein